MIIIFANQKGGVGKTTTAINVAAYTAALGKHVLLVDLDPQANATSALLGSVPRDSTPSIYEVLIGKVPAREALRQTSIEHLHIIPARADLAAAAVELSHMSFREMYLDRALMPLLYDYDVIFVDAPPGLGILTINGFIAANYVIMPVQCEYYALEGMSELLRTIQKLNERFKKKTGVLGIVLTMFDKKSRLARAVRADVQTKSADYVFRTVIPRNDKLAQAPSFGKTILHYAPYSHGAKAYRQLAEEILGLIG